MVLRNCRLTAKPTTAEHYSWGFDWLTCQCQKIYIVINILSLAFHNYFKLVIRKNFQT